MVRRHARSPVAPSAYVFPGGTVRDDDIAFDVGDSVTLAKRLNERSDAPVEAGAAAALYVAAVRELCEEAGVLLVRDAAGHLLEVDATDIPLQERLESTRLALQAHALMLTRVFSDWQWRAAFDALVPFSHWVTPDVLAARFDTRFFVAPMPPVQAALHDTIETSEGVWLAPSRALEDDYHTVYATTSHLRRLQPFKSAADVLRFARTKPIRRVQPEVHEAGEGLRVTLPAELIDTW